VNARTVGHETRNQPYMMKRPSQLPVLLLQFYGHPDLLYRLKETELVYKIFMY
jgi:hypothetical protein